jgi:uncharacterized protein YndB with AHSA1/START domain
MIDIARELGATTREVGGGRLAAGEGRTVRLSRTFDAPLDDVWDAMTNPDRISRWFLPVSGDLRLGGRYQLEGNAGGEVIACERPHRYRVTWVYGEAATPEDVSEVEVRLTANGDESTTVVLEHVAIVPDDRWDEYGPGAVGVGWDGGMLGLALHLRGGRIDDPMAWQLSEEGAAFSTRSSELWGEANVAAGADPEAAARAVAGTTAFYVPGAGASGPDATA